MDLLIYLEKDTARAKYIFHHIFHDILGLNLVFTQDSFFFRDSIVPKINYSKKVFSNELFFQSSDFLSEDILREEDLIFGNYKGVKVFFLCDNSDLPFDPFASSFYMLSRYEEYLISKKDRIGRFCVEDSIAFKNGFLTTPVVDHWILFLKEKLIDRFPNIHCKSRQFEFVNTIDIDNAYAYLEKGFFRTLGASIKDLLSFKIKSFKQRLHVLLFGQKDPYDTYQELLRLHSNYNLKSMFFFLLGDYRFYDRNITSSSIRFQEQIRAISGCCQVGIHASMDSVKNPKKLSVEIKRLKNIIKKKVLHNRQHFLVLNIPDNYRNLIKSGIKHDYSMGFASHPGFRAGTSYSFYFFDLEQNVTTDLLIHPFSLMDVSLKSYLKLSPMNALSFIKEIINSVKRVDGTFISIWHNESLYYENKWKEWDSIYEDMIRYVINGTN